MSPFLPDWMFAAFAVGGWELCNLGATKLHWHWCRAVGYAIVGLCLLVLAIRYTVRFWQRRQHPEQPDPEAWRNY